MHPILFKIPFLEVAIPSYGFLVALGVLLGMVWIHYESKRVGESPSIFSDFAFYLVFFGVLGSRLYYIFFEEEPAFWDEFFQDPLLLFKVWDGGLSYYGGVLAGLLTGLVFILKHHLSFWKAADVIIPGLALGHSIGRLGCFSAGCCYGKPIEGSWFSWGVSFPPSQDIAPVGVPLYPTQVFEAVAELLIFLVLFSFRKHKKWEGQILCLYLFFYPPIRIGVEFLRGDLARDLVGGWGLSAAQYVSGGLIVLGGVVWKLRSKQWYVSKGVE